MVNLLYEFHHNKEINVCIFMSMNWSILGIINIILPLKNSKIKYM